METENIVIAMMDADANDKDQVEKRKKLFEYDSFVFRQRFLSERTVPNIKLFVVGSKVSPVAYRGARITDAMLHFIQVNPTRRRTFFVDANKLS